MITIITGIICLAIGFAAGFLVYNNNKETAQKAVDLGKEIGQSDKKSKR